MAKGPLIYRQKLLTRLTHWVWAVSLFFLLLTGLQIFNSHPALYIGQESGFEYNNAVLALSARQTETGLQGIQPPRDDGRVAVESPCCGRDAAMLDDRNKGVDLLDLRPCSLLHLPHE